MSTAMQTIQSALFGPLRDQTKSLVFQKEYLFLISLFLSKKSKQFQQMCKDQFDNFPLSVMTFLLKNLAVSVYVLLFKRIQWKNSLW